MGHEDIRTTQIYADYMPGERESELIDDAFAPRTNRGPIFANEPLRDPWNACKHTIAVDRNDGLPGSNPGSGMSLKAPLWRGFSFSARRLRRRNPCL